MTPGGPLRTRDMDAPPVKDPALWTPLARFEAAARTRRTGSRAVSPAAGRKIPVLRQTSNCADLGRGRRPGLLLLHGNGAHAGWYRFIAPFFADRYRVAAMSWSGMGASGWRKDRSIPSSPRSSPRRKPQASTPEPRSLYSSAIPSVRSRSPEAAVRHGERFGGIVIVDLPFLTPERREERRRERGTQPQRPRGLHPHRIYPTFGRRWRASARAAAALQQSLHRRPDRPRGPDPAKAEDGSAGWTWRFDPYLWRDFHMPDLTGMFAASNAPAR